jgi:hypothetical protein
MVGSLPVFLRQSTNWHCLHYGKQVRCLHYGKQARCLYYGKQARCLYYGKNWGLPNAGWWITALISTEVNRLNPSTSNCSVKLEPPVASAAIAPYSCVSPRALRQSPSFLSRLDTLSPSRTCLASVKQRIWGGMRYIRRYSVYYSS